MNGGSRGGLTKAVQPGRNGFGARNVPGMAVRTETERERRRKVCSMPCYLKS